MMSITGTMKAQIKPVSYRSQHLYHVMTMIFEFKTSFIIEVSCISNPHASTLIIITVHITIWHCVCACIYHSPAFFLPMHVPKNCMVYSSVHSTHSKQFLTTGINVIDLWLVVLCYSNQLQHMDMGINSWTMINSTSTSADHKQEMLTRSRAILE